MLVAAAASAWLWPEAVLPCSFTFISEIGKAPTPKANGALCSTAPNLCLLELVFGMA